MKQQHCFEVKFHQFPYDFFHSFLLIIQNYYAHIDIQTNSKVSHPRFSLKTVYRLESNCGSSSITLARRSR